MPAAGLLLLPFVPAAAAESAVGAAAPCAGLGLAAAGEEEREGEHEQNGRQFHVNL